MVGCLKALSFCFICVSLLFASCSGDGDKKEKEINEVELKENLIKANQLFVEKENDRINSYIARHKFNMVETGTGLRYQILNKTDGEQAGDGDGVRIAYRLSLLEGDIIVGENDSDTIAFTIGKSEIPSGINEGVQLMHKGEKARFILPTHLAYGLSGDYEKVPPNAALLYSIQLLEIRKINKKTE